MHIMPYFSLRNVHNLLILLTYASFQMKNMYAFVILFIDTCTFFNLFVYANNAYFQLKISTFLFSRSCLFLIVNSIYILSYLFQ